MAKKKKRKKKGGMPPALAAYWRDKRQPKKKRSKSKSKSNPPRKSRSRSMAKKKKRRGGKGKGTSPLFNRKSLIIGGALLGAGYLTKKAADGEANAFREMPIITPLGRWGTLAAVTGGLYAAGVARRTMAPLTIALGGLALFTYGRRGGLYGDEAAVRADILGSGDDGAVYLEGDADEVIDAAASEAGVVG